MTFWGIATVALIGAASGFGLYCFACAFHVWRKRNSPVADGARPLGAAGRLGRVASMVLLLGGVVCAATASIASLIFVPEGLLHGKDLLTVRTPKDLHVQWTVADAAVKPGDLLARFHSPEKEARVEVLRLTIEELQTERAVVERRPLEPDREITRRLLDLGNERRHIESRLNQLEIECDEIQRGLACERLTATDQIRQLETEYAQLTRELTQAQKGLEFDRAQAVRSDELMRRGAGTPRDREQWLRDVKIGVEEVCKLQEQAENVRTQKTDLAEGLAELLSTMQSQATGLRRQIAVLGKQLDEVGGAEAAVQERLKSDLARAAELRSRELQQIDARVRETEKELGGVEQSLREVAAVGGFVVYRAPSPQTVGEGEPLLVVGPHQGLRLQMRLPKWQRKSLQQAAALKLELVSQMDRDAEVERHFVERRFVGRLVQWRGLPNDPSYGLAELSCEPPAEAVRYLSSGNEILVKMHWWPTPLASPLFLGGVLSALLGFAGWTLSSFRRAETASKPHGSAAGPTQQPDRQASWATEYGSEGAVLHLLGVQLREGILRHSVDRHLLAALEWALDRHRARAIRLIATGLAEDDQLGDPLRRFVSGNGSANGSGRHQGLAHEDRRRLIRIVRTVAPRLLAAGSPRPDEAPDDRAGTATVPRNVTTATTPAPR
ncbi:MAG: hypothetical protein JXB62_00660 [Pirellulales bacterium]|nr:hypothetical protein [Pirellulales bacterium]